jgi:cholesterol 25-hydroxylase
MWHQLGLGPLLFGVKPEFGDPTFLRVTAEVSQGVFLYDLLFYPFHLAFHRSRSALWRRQHARHHVWGKEEDVAHNAVETVQNSYLDSGIQVFINICVQQYSPWGFKHPLSRILHNMMVIYLLCEAHSGYDLPFMSHRFLPGIFGGPVRHEAHHQHGGIYYHQFFTYLDNAFGFVPKAKRMPRSGVSIEGAQSTGDRTFRSTADCPPAMDTKGSEM